MNTYLKSFAVVVMSSLLLACHDDDDDDHNPEVVEPDPVVTVNTIVDVARTAGDFTTLISALEATGLDSALADADGSFTVFAPTDDAFALLGSDTIDALLADTDQLTDILNYHVIAGSVVDAEAAVASAGSTVTMNNGDPLALSLSGETLLVNTVQVTATDIAADNGIIHVIDAVLIPPADPGTPTSSIVDIAVGDGNFTTLVAALQAAGLDSVLADTDATFTVFAPTDAAFEALGADNINALLGDSDALSAVLLQHVISDAAVDSITAYTLNGQEAATASGASVSVAINNGMLMVGGATVTTTDIYASNGIIHIIDTVIVGDVELPAPAQSIVDVAVGAGSFTSLVAALQATGLDSVLADTGTDFTVFAPTDEAFAALGQDTIDALFADPDALSDILLYHVISGAEILADAATAVAAGDDSLVDAANGDKLALSLSGESLLINTSTVTAPNVLADNGVIHVIDKVLIPPADRGEPTANIIETAIAAGTFNTLVAAVQAAGLDGTLADPDASFTVFAPTDDAFAALGDETINVLLANTDVLSEILLQHVVAAEVDSVTAYTLNGGVATTAGGKDITVEISGGELRVGGSRVVTTDIYTSNGVIHVIDAVIVGDVEVPEPPVSLVDVAVAAGNFTTLVAALQATGLDAVVGDLGSDYTVFAPTDEAFAALGQETIEALLADPDTLSDILLYHVLPGTVDSTAAVGAAGTTVATANGQNVGLSLSGDNLLVNLSTVTAVDVAADNGVIHVIDTVLTPPAVDTMPAENIVETAVAAGSFTTLVTALQAAGLDTVLADPDEVFTVFAPTDDAFAKIDSAVLDGLIADVPALTQVLLQHVIQGAEVDSVTAFSLSGGSADTAAGDDVTIEIVDGVLQIQGSAVTVFDIYTSNGVIHVIDTVITETLE